MLVPACTQVLEGRMSPLKGPPREGGLLTSCHGFALLLLWLWLQRDRGTDGCGKALSVAHTSLGGYIYHPKGTQVHSPTQLCCRFSPIVLTRTTKPRPWLCWHQRVPDGRSPLHAAWLGSTGMAP